MRSSSYGSYSLCPFSYYLNYVLGIPSISNKAADRGTVIHAVMELLAKIKLQSQDNPKRVTYKDDMIGTIKYKADNIIDIKSHTVDELTANIFDYYASAFSHHKWDKKDKQTCIDLVNQALEFNNGIYNPFTRDIIEVEKHFDFELDDDWASYEYDYKGEKLSGKLALKGTVDNISKIDDECYEVIDYKSGRKWDWAKDIELTDEAIQNSFQLRMYHLALTKLFPNVKELILTIYYINAGGPTTVYFTEKDIKVTKDMIRARYETIKNEDIPQQRKTWKCKAFCSYGKNTCEGTHIKPANEFRPGQTCKIGETMTICEQVYFLAKKFGPEWAMKNLSNPDHKISKYKAPGEI